MGRIIERDVNSLLDAGKTTTTEQVESYLANPAAYKAPAAEPVQADKAVVPTAEAPAKAAYTDVKVTNIRRVIAKSMHASLSTMAQLTLNSSFDATELLDYRAKVKASGEALGMANITLNDMVLFAVAKT